MIPFTRPLVEEDDIKAVEQAMRNLQLVGDGPICKRVEVTMEEAFGAKHVLLTPSGTHALELAIMVLEFGPGDEVILPSFSFSSVANAILLRGAEPVFADIQPATLNLDPVDVRRKITARTRAIMPVHYAGVSADMDALIDIAREQGLSIVEDAAQGVDAAYKGRFLGTIGDIGCYSFHSTKNITCGEGGAFLTNDDSIARRAEVVREKGTDRSAFLRGEIDKYSWRAPGSSYLLSDMQAAMLESQLAKRTTIKAQRQAIWKRYYEVCADLAAEGLIDMPVVPVDCDTNFHLFFFFAKTPAQRDQMLSRMKAGGVNATFHFVPLHTSPFAQERQNQHPQSALPVTDERSAALIRLPLYNAMSPVEMETVIQVTQEVVRAVAR